MADLNRNAWRVERILLINELSVLAGGCTTRSGVWGVWVDATAIRAALGTIRPRPDGGWTDDFVSEAKAGMKRFLAELLESGEA